MTYSGGLRVATMMACTALALTACGGQDDTDSSAADPESSEAAPPSESAAVLTATCKLKGKSGGTVTLKQADDGLVMSFSGLPVPTSGDVLYSVTAFDEAGENGGQLGAKFQSGEQIAFFVFDFGTAEQTNLDGAPEVSGDTVTATVADADLGPLSGVDVASWSAAYSVNGEDVGICPGGMDPLPFPG